MQEDNNKVHVGEQETVLQDMSDATVQEDGQVLSEASRLALLETRCREFEDLYLRARAEADNVRRQSSEELGKVRRYALEKYATELLGVKDSLELALSAEKQSLETLLTGVQMTLRQLESVFGHMQVTAIDPVHEIFNPHFHQAMSTEPTEAHLPNTVTRVLQKGYLLAGDRVLRPALVVVATAIPAAE